MAQLGPGWIAAPVRIDGDGAGDAAFCVGAGAVLLIAGAVGVVMTGVAVEVVGMTGGNGVLVGGVLGAAAGGGGGAASVNNKASTDSCVNVMA